MATAAITTVLLGWALIAAAYYAGAYWIEKKQLNYQNPDVVAYVQAVPRRYMMRKYAAARPPRR